MSAGPAPRTPARPGSAARDTPQGPLPGTPFDAAPPGPGGPAGDVLHGRGPVLDGPARLSRAAVARALRAEAAAPAGQVLRGVAHRNTVVRAGGRRIVVRRPVAAGERLERGGLSESAVLRAVEDAAVPVRAPRVLAEGADSGGRFALHSYEAPGGGRPGHPVDGLTPREADDLTAQLAALTGVDPARLDPAAVEGDFHARLCGDLVALVARLHPPALRLAGELGLPDPPRLRDLLARHTVTRRAPALLHGDLNPWNLVRRGDGTLTLIDWELAAVGDPLYDLVRHLHLTPTPPARHGPMLRAWSALLPERFTRDAERDWPRYRALEAIRSAYVDLDRLVTGVGLDAPNVRRAVDSYAGTLRAATAALGLRVRDTAHLARALPLP